MDFKELMRSRATDIFQEDLVYLGFLDGVGEIFNQKYQEVKDYEKVIWNIDLSTGYQLDLIGNIVGQSRKLLNIDEGIYFGFENSPNSETFGTISDPNIGGNWKSILNNPTSTTVKKLDDSIYRKMIKARIIKNISNGTINDFLKVINILEENTTTRIDGNNVVIVGPIKPLTSYLLEKRTETDSIFPIPLGVKLNILEI